MDDAQQFGDNLDKKNQVILLNMSFQFTFDAKGNPVGVFVPIREWEKITSELKKRSSKKSGTLAGIEKGLKQVKQIERGKLKSISLKQLLNDL